MDLATRSATASLDPAEFDAIVFEATQLRRQIHRRPELGFEESLTSDLVAERLESWGYEVHRNIGGTGLVGQLKLGSGTRRLGIRADMDALPIQEDTGLAYQSEHAGKMHACGHDGHTATLLGAARLIAETRRFSGTLNLVFQPAEEGRGGARRMLDEGLFSRFPCDAIFALHNAPGVPTGKLVFIEGPAMASTDHAVITVRGVGGHGAMPHLAQDPVLAASAIVVALQGIVARNIDPRRAGVITVGVLRAGTTANVIPHEAHLELSIRSHDPAVRDQLEKRVREVTRSQAESYGCRAEVDYRVGNPVLVNSAAETAFARDVARDLIGADLVGLNHQATLGSEDFAHMLEACPGCYFLIGNGDGKECCSIHHPGYDFNDAALPVGISYWAALAERFLR